MPRPGSTATGFSLALVILATAATATADSARSVLLVRRASADEDAADLARALRPHLASAEATLRLARADPPSADLTRAAWGAELAAREGVDVVLWLEPTPDDGLTLHLVDARARVAHVVAPPGDRFDQLRTVALAARSHVARMVERARDEHAAEERSLEPPVAAPPVAARPPARRVTLSPSVTAGAFIGGSDRLAFGARLEGALRVGRLLFVAVGAELVPAEELGPLNDAGAGSRARLPVVLGVGLVLPAGPVDLLTGIEGALTVSFLSREDLSRTRVAPLLGLRAAARVPLSEPVFLEIPVSARVRLASPGSDAAFSQAAVAPGFEVLAGVAVGIGR